MTEKELDNEKTDSLMCRLRSWKIHFERCSERAYLRQLCLYFTVTEDFTPDDDEWGCYAVYTSDKMLMINTNGEMEWEDVIKNTARLLKKYLREGKNRSIIKKYKGIGTAFPDSDIEYIYINKSKNKVINNE